MESNLKIKAVLFKGKIYADGTHPILIRVTNNRRHTYKAVGYSIKDYAWDEENHLVYEKKPIITKRQEGQLSNQKLDYLKHRYANAILLYNAKQINEAIKDKIVEISLITQKLKVNGDSLDIHNIRSNIKPNSGNSKNLSFTVYATAKQEKLLASGHIGTYKRYKSILEYLKKYRKERDLLFSNIDFNFLEAYEIHLQGEKYKINTIHNHFKTIRAIYYSAIKEGIITSDKNPFFIFKSKNDSNTKKEKLNVEEILKLETEPLEKGSLMWHARNYFLFSFYCAGIRVSDLLQLKWENIINERVEYKMEKTGSIKSIALLPKAKIILAEYKGPDVKKTDFVFPMLDTRQDLSDPLTLLNQISSKTVIINKYLKKLAEKVEIDKPITTHIARHSFSDIARKRGTNIYDISKMLGHSSIKITEAYLASIDLESQDESHINAMDF